MQSTIDHILTNNSESILKSGVLTYIISDHFPIFCKIRNPNFTATTFINKDTFQNIHSMDKTLFFNDLDLRQTSLLTNLNKSPITTALFQNDFKKLILAISNIIKKQASVQNASKKRRRLL